MITQYRPAYYTTPRASEFAGRSIDTKPIDVENGSEFTEIDTGRTYKFDAENKVWLEVKGGATDTNNMKKTVYDPTNAVAEAGGIADYVSDATSGYVPDTRTVNSRPLSADIELQASDVGALATTGGTLTGDLTIAPEGRTNIITATMGSGANIVVKENDDALTMMTFNPASKSIILADGTTQESITLRGVAEPQIDTDAVNKKYIEETYGTKEGSATFTFPGVWKVKNVASPGDEHDGANKYYVDHKVMVSTHTIHSLSLDAGATHTEQVSVSLPLGVTSVGYDFYATVSGNNLAALLSVTKTEAVASSSGSWLRTTYLAYNPGTAAVTGDVIITVLCISK